MKSAQRGCAQPGYIYWGITLTRGTCIRSAQKDARSPQSQMLISGKTHLEETR